MRTPALALTLVLAGVASPALAQSTGYVTGFPGRDPAGDDAIGWGPAYRPETSFSQPGTPPTPGDFAGAAYRARTGRGPYDAVQGNGLRGARYVPEAGMDEVSPAPPAPGPPPAPASDPSPLKAPTGPERLPRVASGASAPQVGP